MPKLARSLSIYWDQDVFILIEEEKGQALKTISIPAKSFNESNPQQLRGVAEEIKMRAVLQNVLREHSITTRDAYLALSSNDIIIRTFRIPWSTPHEIKSIIEFEAKKYVPFELADLNYSYKAIEVSNKVEKAFEIIFVAVKRSTLEKYTDALHLCNLNLIAVEPAPMGLARSLINRQTVSVDGVAACLEFSGDHAQVTILNNGIPEFARDFSVKLPEESAKEGATLTKIKILNEVRVSLDFYEREQVDGKQIDELVFVSCDENSRDYCVYLEQELGMKVKYADPKDILQQPSVDNAHFVSAIGLTFEEDFKAFPPFDLSEEGGHEAGAKAKEEAEKKENFVPTMQIGAVCLALVAGAFFWTDNMVKEQKIEMNKVKSTLGKHSDLTKDEIETKIITIDKKMAVLDTIPENSNVSQLMLSISKALPETVWLKEFRISYQIIDDTKKKKKKKRSRRKKKTIKFTKQKSISSIQLDGYAYHQDDDQHIPLINQFIRNVEGRLVTEGEFSNVNLEAIKKTALNEIPVTQFKIVCD